MLKKKGFTLVELMIGLIVLAMLATAIQRVVGVMMRATSAQIGVATSQSNSRIGVTAIPQEFREIGYDTIPWGLGGVTSDLEAIAPNRITFRAMRGMATTCGTNAGLTQFWIRKPVIGLRDPLLTDGFFLYVENDRNTSVDDQWVPMLVINIENSDCGGIPAFKITLSALPIVDPVSLAGLSASNFFVGGPIRWYERLEYAPLIDATTSLAYIGVRSLSLGQATLSPIIGPMPDTGSFRLTYFNAAGTALDPASSPVTSVRNIGISITGVPRANGSLAGTAKRTDLRTVFTTQVALRNTLRP